MKTVFVTLLLSLVLFACSLNGQQEAALNSARIAYVDARNNNKVSLLIKLTYADAVRFYQNQGDSVFKERFRPENNLIYLQNGSLKEVETSGGAIHVKFEFESIREEDLDIVMEPMNLYAISSDDGVHWKFLDENEYQNPEILPKNKKLIKD